MKWFGHQTKVEDLDEMPGFGGTEQIKEGA
jgi:hypothetical protein